MFLKTKLVRIAFITILLIPFQFIVEAQNNDGMKITEARIAIEKYKDYQAALKALNEVSEAGQNNPLFIFYAATANEQLGKLREAVKYYNKYLTVFPNKIEIIEKIADLNYKVRTFDIDLTGEYMYSDKKYFLNNKNHKDSIYILPFDHAGYFKLRKDGTTLTGTYTCKLENLNKYCRDYKEVPCSGVIRDDGETIEVSYNEIVLASNCTAIVHDAFTKYEFKKVIK